MKIHDALVLELIRADKTGKPTGPIINIIGTANIEYRLEQLVRFTKTVRYYTPSSFERLTRLVVGESHLRTIVEEMTPDILVRKLEKAPKAKEAIVIELETDADFDFGASLRQIRKYAERFANVIVIIPKEHEPFATLYKSQGFRVLLWSAVRQWRCLRCGNVVDKEGSIPPKCEKCKKHTQQELVGLESAKFEEFAKQP